MLEICERVNEKLRVYAIGRRGNSTETEVFFNKMVGDFFRYKIEFMNPKSKDFIMAIREGTKFYDRAWDIANNGMGFKKALGICNPTRVSVLMHFCNWKFEVLNKPDDALEMAQIAIDLITPELDMQTEDVFIESTHIIELLRENMHLWKHGDKMEREKDKKSRPKDPIKVV